MNVSMPVAWRGTHSHSTTKPTPKPKDSTAGAIFAGLTLLALGGSFTGAVISAADGHEVAAGGCIVGFGLVLVLYGLFARYVHDKADQPEPDEHERAVLWLADMDPEYRRLRQSYASRKDTHTRAAAAERRQMQAIIHAAFERGRA